MKPRYFLFRALLVSVLGLISCGPDESVEAKTMLIEQSDGKTEPIKGMRTINPTDSLFIEDLDEELQVEVESLCYTKKGVNEYRKNTVIKDFKIPFLPLLPPEVFLPIAPGQKEFLCEFNGTISSPTLGEEKLSFSQPMSIKNTNAFHNINWQDIQPDWSPELTRTELIDLDIPASLQNKKIVTLCESNKAVTNFSDNITKTADLFVDEVFGNQSSVNCRLWFENEPTEISVTPIFKLVKEEINLQLSQEVHFVVKDQIDHRKSPMITLKFENMNSFPIHFSHQAVTTNIQFTPYFMYDSTDTLYFETIYNIEGTWVYRGPEPNRFKEVALLPGQSIEFVLYTHQYLNCGDWMAKARSTGGAFAAMNPTNMGYKIKVDALPILSQPRHRASNHRQEKEIHNYLGHDISTLEKWVPTHKPWELLQGRTEIPNIEGYSLSHWNDFLQRNRPLGIHTAQCEAL